MSKTWKRRRGRRAWRRHFAPAQLYNRTHVASVVPPPVAVAPVVAPAAEAERPETCIVKASLTVVFARGLGGFIATRKRRPVPVPAP